LLVDDEPDVIVALKTVLEENEFKVDSFVDPVLALKNFEADLYDLLVFDIKMPQLNGFELYREIRKIDPTTKVCFLTALSEFQEYDEFKKDVSPKSGERYFIAKPIDNETMLERVNEMIASQ
jgi:DNA-binding response OmpR family regulator